MVISQKKAVKKKLMAATSMLLIACIMLISSSYAWFTLSTAPEVTGITTTVGANGNLEIALATKSTWTTPSTITSAVGDSQDATKDATVSNVSWGNIVDLSSATYGLNGVVLSPARLNIVPNTSGDGWELKEGAALKTPAYGSDGRISDLKDGGYFGWYDAQNAKYQILEEHMGVRIIGANSGMTDREIAYRTSKTELSSKISETRSSAIRSLQENGGALAGSIVNYALDPNTEFTAADVKAIEDVLSELQTNAVPALYDGWEASVVAYAASAEGQKTAGLETDANFETFRLGLETASYNPTSGDFVSGNISLPLDATTKQMYADIVAIEGAIEGAIKALPTVAEGDTITWAELSVAVRPLFNTETIMINGMTVEYVKANKDTAAAKIMADKPNVQMGNDSGIYADIAEFVGNYSATIDIPMGDATIPATMSTVLDFSDTTKFPGQKAFLPYALDVVTTAGAPSSKGSSNDAMDDQYGYAIDMFLRTNASQADLKLQIAEAQRVYTDSTSEATQGGGSNMTFNATDAASFSVENMKELMTAVRVVFMDGEQNILGIAVLDTANATAGDEGLKADLKLVNYSAVEDNYGYKLQITTTTDEAGNVVPSFLTEQTLMAMSQSEAMKLTALVYLDGDVVDNSMVSTAVTSMKGMLNLQFASSVPLNPMDNTALFNYADEEDAETP